MNANVGIFETMKTKSHRKNEIDQGRSLGVLAVLVLRPWILHEINDGRLLQAFPGIPRKVTDESLAWSCKMGLTIRSHVRWDWRYEVRRHEEDDGLTFQHGHAG